MTELKETSIKEALYAPLTVDSRRGRGGTYGYVKWQAVADRMNETFGMNWSSHVASETIDEHGTVITVRVAVCAKDPMSGEQYCQEGYGASQIRSSDEPGSAHKGAYSKALKDACKKWGIGLHLEDGNASAPASIPSGYMGHETAPAPAVPNVMAPATPAPAPAPMMPSVPVDVVPTPAAPVTQAAPVVPTAPVANHPTAAPVPPAAPMVPTAEMGLPATPAPAGVNPIAPVPAAPTPVQVPNTAPAVAPAAVSTADTPGSITSVQDMAIQNLARLNGPEGTTADTFLQGLVEDPECALNRRVTSLNELSYNEAVCVIKAAKSL